MLLDWSEQTLTANLGVVRKVGVVWEWSAEMSVVSHVEPHIIENIFLHHRSYSPAKADSHPVRAQAAADKNDTNK
jgi:hypothetical protein